jgi:type IV pilus assembly protein PilQ
MIILCFNGLIYADLPVSLIGIETRSMPGNKAQILLEFSGPPPTPTGFSMENPSKMIFDFPDVQNNLSKQISTQKLVLGVVTAVNFIQSASKTRLIVSVLNIVPYSVDYDRNKIILTLSNDFSSPLQSTLNNEYTISSLDFHRGEQGEGRLIIDFSQDTVPVDFSEDDNEMRVEFRGATIPEKLLRRFDVTDFGTNIKNVNVERVDDNVVIHIIATGDYEKVAYQLDKQYIVQVRPMIAGSLEQLSSQKFKFTGERISLNFQDIKIRSVLQLIADFTNLNLVISDSVQGNVTLRLENIPWDEALAFILQSKGLAQRTSGNIILIAPSEEMNAREQLALASQQQVQALAPLESEFIQINYAKAADMVTMIKDKTNNLLSERGQISVDTRTNTLLVKDTAENIISIKQLIERLDIPVRQVMIESQIVETTNNYTDAFGVQMGGAATSQLGKYTLGIAPTMQTARQFADSPTTKNTTANNLFFDFSDSAAKGLLGLALAKLPGGTLIDLELQASELESKTKTVARPKLVTLDGQTASIETGQEIPYTTTAQAGSTPTTTFKSAVLKLEVTPQITPNNKISMDLSVNNDAPTTTTFDGQVGINTTSMNTKILVDDGETIVLGGIFKVNTGNTVQSIPYLNKIPIIGGIFRSSNTTMSRDEILIFVTPRIIKNLVSR